jgi:antitoxin component YwqK of YwqJK toxin-antitoxin module
MLTRILLSFILLVSMDSCKKESTVIESAFPDGSPKRVCIYKGTGNNKEMLRETTYYPGKKLQMDGAYLHNKRNGRWVFYYSNGNIWSDGFFKNGESDGKRTIYFENGKIKYEAYYKEGVRTGKWRFYDEKGNLIKEIDYSKESSPQ